MIKKALIVLTASSLFAYAASGQDDLLQIAMQNHTESNLKEIATFKTTKLINLHTNETVHKRTLDFRVGHRFGNIGTGSHGGIHTFYGLDASTDIRIAFEYGLTDRLMAGVSRSKRNENYEGLIKFRALEQTIDNKIPVAITLFANTAIAGIRDPEGLFPKTTDRMSYAFQVILARKFSDKASVVLIPTLLHRNFIFNPEDKNDLMSLGFGGRFKFTRSSSVVFDYCYHFDKLRRPGNDNGYYAALGAGVEIETGGHVFTVMFTNASGIIENDFIPNTSDSWSKGGFKFSFNISRNFKL